MKYYICLASFVCALFSGVSFNASADGGVTANVGVTNNYLWRGITQSDKKPAVSGGLDYSHNSGFYAGVWGSNVDFGSGSDASTEVDLYAGFANKLGDISYDFGYIYYEYPDGDNVNFSEVMASISWNFVSIGISTLADSDWDSDFGDDTYYEINFSFEAIKDVELGIHIGGYEYDKGRDYQDYNISLSKGGFSFMVSHVSEDEIEDDYTVTISYTHEINL